MEAALCCYALGAARASGVGSRGSARRLSNGPRACGRRERKRVAASGSWARGRRAVTRVLYQGSVMLSELPDFGGPPRLLLSTPHGASVVLDVREAWRVEEALLLWRYSVKYRKSNLPGAAGGGSPGSTGGSGGASEKGG